MEEALQIKISDLERWGFLEPAQENKGGIIAWKYSDGTPASVGIVVNIHDEQPYIELFYEYDEKHRIYKVQLNSVPLNSGKTKIWYFICPLTKKRCRPRNPKKQI